MGNLNFSSDWFISLVVGAVIVIVLALVFFVLYTMYAKQKRKSIEAGLEDEKIRHTIEKRIQKIKSDPVEGFDNKLLPLANSPFLLSWRNGEKDSCVSEKLLVKTSETGGVTNALVNVCSGVFFVVAGVLFGLGIYSGVNHGLVDFGGTSLLTIESGSMSQKVNYFSKDYDNQIATHSLILVHKADYSSLKVGDVIAFYDDAENMNRIVVHRIFKVNDDGTYQTMGDSNLRSDASEMSVKQEQIRGIYKDENLGTGLGLVVSYIKAPVGWVAMASFALFIIGYAILDDKIEKTYKEREKVLTPNLKVWIY